MKNILAIMLLAISSASYGDWKTTDSLATRTVTASNQTVGIGLTCDKGNNRSLQGFLALSIPPAQNIDFRISTGQPKNDLIITGYGFYGSRTSWIDLENIDQFVALLNSGAELTVTAGPASSLDTWSKKVIAKIKIENSAGVISTVCSQ